MPELVTEQGNGHTDEAVRDSESPELGPETGEWCRKPEAATRLGISERMVEKRIAAGRLRKRVRIDGVTEVLVPRSSEDVSVQKAIELVERFNGQLSSTISPLVQTIRAQAEEIGRLKGRIEELERVPNPVPKPWWRFWSS
jgi:hypothetical protein